MFVFTSGRVFLPLLLGVLLVSGCASFLGLLDGFGTRGAAPGSHAPSAEPRAVSGDTKSFDSQGNGIRVIYLAFDLLRAEFVVDEVQHSKKVWNHVDEMRVEAGVAARLARNGFRIGVASADTWPLIRAIFNTAGANVRQQQFVARGSAPLSIPMTSIEVPESIFSYGRDGRLVGRTFQGGSKLINVGYSYRPELGGVTDLRISFEVRRQQDELTWQKRGALIEQAVGIERYLFDGLEAAVTVRSNEFLVIGLTDFKQNEYLVGSRFLTFTRSGVRYERLLCITPRALQGADLRRWAP